MLLVQVQKMLNLIFAQFMNLTKNLVWEKGLKFIESVKTLACCWSGAYKEAKAKDNTHPPGCTFKYCILPSLIFSVHSRLE